MRRSLAISLALGLAVTLAGCGGDARQQVSGRTTASASESPSEATDAPTQPGTGATEQPPPEGGPADRPAAVQPEPLQLEWRRVPGPVGATVTGNGRWTLAYGEAGTEATLDGPDPATVTAPGRHRIADALIDDSYAVVVTEDEQAQQPSIATVIDLDSGDRFTIDGSADVPTTTGGTWALGNGRLLHATIGPGRAYCLASVDLATRESETTWCAPERHGFNGARVTPAGASLMVFDDARPSCRTVAAVEGDRIEAFAGVPECTGWDGALLDDGAIWSVVRNANRVEDAHFYARIGDGYFDLGPGTSGSLAWCGDAAYFVRDPQRDGDRARLMRWTPGGSLGVAYETSGRGQAFLAEPRCGGEWISVTAFAESGDLQVTAPVRSAGT